jgi:hypothetical protein
MLNVQEIFKTSMLGIQTDQSEPGCSDQLVLVHLQGASHVVQQNKFNPVLVPQVFAGSGKTTRMALE